MSKVDRSGRWDGKYVAICDSGPATPAYRGKRAEAYGAKRDKPQVESLSVSHERGAQLLETKQVLEYANNAWKTEWFRAPTFQEVLKETNASQPFLVQRLDCANSVYYLVPMQKEELIPAVIMIDGSSGSYNEAVLRDETRRLFQVDSPEAARKLVAAKNIPIPDTPPGLVWKPCRESSTPLCPFYMFTHGGDHIYVRTDDGSVFTELHDQWGIRAKAVAVPE
jgi:hypothetical protein